MSKDNPFTDPSADLPVDLREYLSSGGHSPPPGADAVPAGPKPFRVSAPPLDCSGLWQVCSVPPHRHDVLAGLLGSGWEPVNAAAVVLMDSSPVNPGQVEQRVLIGWQLRRKAPEGTPPEHLVIVIGD